MKNKIKYIVFTTMFLLTVACGKEFLDIIPQDRITADNFYRTEADVRSNTATMYGVPWFLFNDKFFWCAGDVMAGDIFHDWDQEGQFFFFTVQDGNAILSQGWIGLFRVISYANSVINDMPPAASDYVSQDIINRALGEARFIRATAYFMLAEFWGEVPIIENSTQLITSNNMTVPKATRPSVYEFIKRDLEFAIANLPITDVPGRVTQWSAKGLLAKLYVTMAQNLSDPNSDSYFSEAKELAADVIENSGHTLMTNYYDLFTIANNNNSESLFAMQWMVSNWSYGNSRQSVFARSSIITGNPQAWGGGKSVTYNFMQNIESGDGRRRSIYMQLGDVYPDINVAEGGYTYNIVSRNPATNTVTESAAPLLNNLKKYVVGSNDDVGGVGSNQDVANNQYVLRLADIYLIYAEAELGSGNQTTDATALQYFNAIRNRAHLGALSSITFNDILKERRVEFALEGLNWLDIKRFYYRSPQAALDYLNAQNRALRYNRVGGTNPPSENSTAGYTLNTPNPVIATAEDMILPIPVAEIGTNPLLAPNVPAEEYIFE
jgi:hypothetical protein